MKIISIRGVSNNSWEDAISVAMVSLYNVFKDPYDIKVSELLLEGLMFVAILTAKVIN